MLTGHQLACHQSYLFKLHLDLKQWLHRGGEVVCFQWLYIVDGSGDSANLQQPRRSGDRDGGQESIVPIVEDISDHKDSPDCPQIDDWRAGL